MKHQRGFSLPTAIFLLVITALRAQPGRPRIIPVATSIAAAVVLADTFVPAPLYLTAGVLVALVAVLTAATRTRAGASPDAPPAADSGSADS